MEIIKLRSNRSRTGDNRITNINLRTKRAAYEAASRSADHSYSPDSSQYSTGSSLVPDFGSMAGYGYAPRKRSLDNTQLHQRQYKSEQDFYEQGDFRYRTDYDRQRSKTMQDSAIPMGRSPSRDIPMGKSGVPDNPLNTSRTFNSDLSVPDDVVEEVLPPTGYRNEESQTRRLNLMKVYLPGIKEHSLWRKEKGDPFIEAMRKEILKNKPASIEEFVIALCEARKEGGTVPLPVTIVEHRGLGLNSIIFKPKKKALIKLKSIEKFNTPLPVAVSSDVVDSNLISDNLPSLTRLNKTARPTMQSSFRDSFTLEEMGISSSNLKMGTSSSNLKNVGAK